MNISELVKDRTVHFHYYRSGVLYYGVAPRELYEDYFVFPIPIEDTNGATFPSEEKAIFFMRWIRKHLESINSNKSGAV